MKILVIGGSATQPIMPRVQSDLLAYCLAALDGRLERETASWDLCSALGVVLAAGGYPGDYPKGELIEGLPNREQADRKVFRAGTALTDGKAVSAGSRVLCVTALGNSFAKAQSAAHELSGQISCDGMFFCRDIGHRSIARELV